MLYSAVLEIIGWQYRDASYQPVLTVIRGFSPGPIAFDWLDILALLVLLTLAEGVWYC